MIAPFMLREVVRLLSSKITLSFRRIEDMTGCPHQTVGCINKRFIDSGLSLEDVEKLNDEGLQLAFYPKLKSKPSMIPQPDFEAIIKECLTKHKSRKSIMLMYIQYKAMFGKKGYERAQFYKRVREVLKAHRIVLKHLYVPGEILFIDFAGLTLQYRYGGKEIKLYVFVACLGYSKRLFAFATRDMTSVSWCQALYRAFEYYGGVPDVVQFDNAKAMVITPGQLALFNKDIRELASYCNCLCDTSRVGTPPDNGAVESSVKFVTQRVLVPMKRDLTFFSIEEVNRYLIAEVDKLNHLPIQQRDLSRNELFFTNEQQALAALPLIPYEPTLYRKEIQVPANYLVRYQGNEYSVPFELAHKRIEMKVKGGKLYILHQNQVRASHNVVDGRDNVVRVDEHLKPEHKAELSKTKDNYLAWARTVGQSAVSVVELQYAGLKNPSSRLAGKYCHRLQKLCRKYGNEVFEQACLYAITHSMSSPNDIELILKAKPFSGPESESTPPVDHANIRGPRYYGGTDHEQ
ncbi:Mu transposase domain-containing protein [Pseudoalteromonas sp. T1lg88]|uniref:Mu transposase domain-containing protein n=1 Tax=Pseudoalteromonas sp. T1lg88 TaxID=2077104 RepID=UPI000CF6E657|nr:DDE-type integrase/transposase/recombinase [Pseudoalteromonas sp. T1lg88]